MQVAKFPFEEIPATKQAEKQESCHSSSVSSSAVSPVSAEALDAEIKNGENLEQSFPFSLCLCCYLVSCISQLFSAASLKICFVI